MFLRNAWYVAALAEEITRAPLGRVLLEEPVVLFRNEKGAAIALEDRCSHRNFPLSKGRLIGDELQCGYHGLRFDCEGRCVGVPGQSHAPPNAAIRKYPLLERWGWIWLWMGDSAAPTAEPIDFHWLDDPAWGAKAERLYIKCDYRLILDNLLDLSHLTFVHPGTIGSMDNIERAQISNDLGEESVTVTRWLRNIAPPPTYTRAGFAGNIDRWQIIRFEPPAFVNLYAGAVDAGAPPHVSGKGGIGLRNLNAITPETATTSHYFWAIAQDRAPADQAATNAIFDEIHRTFLEDWEVLETHQRANLRAGDAHCVNINSDAGPLHARRIIERMLAAQRPPPIKLRA